MKREDVSKIFEGATEEQITSILDINSADIGKAKGDYENLKEELKASKETAETLTRELNTLKEAGASAEEWKKKFEDLSDEIEQKEAAAKAEKEKAEREAEIQSRYNAVCVDKDGKPLEFAHEAIRAEYLKKFGEILSDADNAEYKGKSDAEIFHALTKDDAAAFKGVQASLDLPGGKQFGGGAEPTTLLGALREQYGK